MLRLQHRPQNNSCEKEAFIRAEGVKTHREEKTEMCNLPEESRKINEKELIATCQILQDPTTTTTTIKTQKHLHQIHPGL